MKAWVLEILLDPGVVIPTLIVLVLMAAAAAGIVAYMKSAKRRRLKNETAQRINSLLNDFEEPVRAMLPQVRRTIDAAESMSTRLSGPIDEVIPGLNRLAETLNSPVLQTMPADLGEFMNVINDLSRRLGPLGQFAEQAGKMFGLRPPPASSPPAKEQPPPKKPPASG